MCVGDDVGSTTATTTENNIDQLYLRGVRDMEGWFMNIHKTLFQHVQIAVVRSDGLSMHRIRINRIVTECRAHRQ